MKLTLTPFDVVADARTCGNTHLIWNRVILFGSRQKFEEGAALSQLSCRDKVTSALPGLPAGLPRPTYAGANTRSAGTE